VIFTHFPFDDKRLACFNPEPRTLNRLTWVLLCLNPCLLLHKAVRCFDRASDMHEGEIERGYANLHRRLNHILRTREVRAFKHHVARPPRQAGRLSQCLGLKDELALVEMYKAILIRSALKDLYAEARERLTDRGVELPPEG
jgi:hypothetical protein